jgi:protein KRI1
MAAAKPMFSDESASDSGSGSGSSSSSSSSDSDSKAKAKEDSSKNVVSGKPTDTFTVNRQYAERFEHNKRREETHRLAEKVKREYIIRPGDIGEDSDSDTSSSESDEGDVPVKFDTQFAKALLRIKNKDPAIYDEEKALFSDDDDDDVDEAKKKRKKKAPKKQTLRQVTAAQLLEGGAEALEQEEQEMLTLQKTTTGRSYVEEQADLKNAFKHAAGIDGTEAGTMGKSKKKFVGKSQDAMDIDLDSDSGSDSDSGGLKVKRRDVGFLGDDGGSSDDDDADEAGTQKAAEAKARLGEFFGTEKASDKNEQVRISH